jgi:transposase InsO family protein
LIYNRFNFTYRFIMRGPPSFVRSDNGPEFIAEAVRDWISAVGAKTAYIEPGSPWENGYCESFNARLRDELPACRLSSSPKKPVWGMPHTGLNNPPAQGNILKSDSPYDWRELGSQVSLYMGS